MLQETVQQLQSAETATHIEIISGILLPIVGMWWKSTRDTKKQHKEAIDAITGSVDALGAKLDKMYTEQEILVPHYHQEDEGPLTAEGIIKKERRS